jgi:hypothetical protein
MRLLRALRRSGRSGNNGGCRSIRAARAPNYDAPSLTTVEMTMMKALCAVTAMSVASPVPAAEPAPHRYMVERTFPAGALDGVDAAAKQKVNANNRSLGVNWEKSYANANKTKTYCVYTGPSADAVREAAKLNGLPVDTLTEIPADLQAEPRGAVQKIAGGNHRYLVRRSGAPTVRADGDAKFGVKLLTSYGAADQGSSFWVYEAPDMAAIEGAAKASGVPFESIAEIPETLYPN